MTDTYNGINEVEKVVSPLHVWQHEISEPRSNWKPFDDVKAKLVTNGQ